MSLNPVQLDFIHPAPPLIDTLLQRVEEHILELIRSIPPTDLYILSDLKQATVYHITSGGQRIRARLALQAAINLGLPPADATIIATSVELVHNASLIHDDLQDRDRIRRGQSSVWVAFGDNIAICSGDLLLSMAYQILSQFSQFKLIPNLINLVHGSIAQAIAGQCADLQTQNHPVDSIHIFEKIVVGKSGAFLSLPLELALVATDNSQALSIANQASQSLALGYQIVDDLDDIESDLQKDGRLPSLNICLVLQTLGHKDDFRSLAKKLAIKHLEKAQDLAQQLPKGSGDFTRELAQYLVQHL
jgi:geranylgeranyl pyrophosphate synthase